MYSTLKATKIHLALKLINKSFHLLRNLELPLSVSFTVQNINNLLQQISLYTKQSITLCQAQDITINYPHFKQTLKQLQKTLWKARSLEILNDQKEKINFYIQC